MRKLEFDDIALFWFFNKTIMNWHHKDSSMQCLINICTTENGPVINPVTVTMRPVGHKKPNFHYKINSYLFKMVSFPDSSDCLTQNLPSPLVPLPNQTPCTKTNPNHHFVNKIQGKNTVHSFTYHDKTNFVKFCVKLVLHIVPFVIVVTKCEVLSSVEIVPHLSKGMEDIWEMYIILEVK